MSKFDMSKQKTKMDIDDGSSGLNPITSIINIMLAPLVSLLNCLAALRRLLNACLAALHRLLKATGIKLMNIANMKATGGMSMEMNNNAKLVLNAKKAVMIGRSSATNDSCSSSVKVLTTTDRLRLRRDLRCGRGGCDTVIKSGCCFGAMKVVSCLICPLAASKYDISKV